jgi:hypothetical protein
MAQTFMGPSLPNQRLLHIAGCNAKGSSTIHAQRGKRR